MTECVRTRVRKAPGEAGKTKELLPEGMRGEGHTGEGAPGQGGLSPYLISVLFGLVTVSIFIL